MPVVTICRELARRATPRSTSSLCQWLRFVVNSHVVPLLGQHPRYFSDYDLSWTRTSCPCCINILVMPVVIIFTPTPYWWLCLHCTDVTYYVIETVGWASRSNAITQLSLLCTIIMVPMAQAVLTHRLTGSGFDLACFSSLFSACLCIFSLHLAILHTHRYT